ncbi:MAG: bifunctional hydroxymethylpyrimidine kinase/phosphomethylpyrimidine kinase [Alphaproteobacteria bacterium]|nr:bifunctional hydroxymethylpyrimidine kinase/phosphomethylpyrimidine kinase [Alphaproteobacteria bacterium]
MGDDCSSYKNLARILVIAGSDSGSAAGIQADIKTIMQLGGYATTAIAALTAQNTQTITDIFAVPVSFLEAQIKAIMSDIGADIIKTGMLYSDENILFTSQFLKENPHIPSIVDPVLKATTGASLTQDDKADLYRQYLIPTATLVTPNIIEAETLTGIPIKTVNDMQAAALAIYQMGCKAVLVKGGHLQSSSITDVLFDGIRWHLFTSPRISIRDVHGTGCTLAAAIACALAQKKSLTEAVQYARTYVIAAIEQALPIGCKYAPLNHAVSITTFQPEGV